MKRRIDDLISDLKFAIKSKDPSVFSLQQVLTGD
jgi:hypothetical protein